FAVPLQGRFLARAFSFPHRPFDHSANPLSPSRRTTRPGLEHALRDSARLFLLPRVSVDLAILKDVAQRTSEPRPSGSGPYATRQLNPMDAKRFLTSAARTSSH